ncbi:MAG: hypothetical protein D6772_15740 [Bacteroidetes bacterium]|nr:MAG: hypothetical protein D6772_15740 [Bacteroidota bacterium]
MLPDELTPEQHLHMALAYYDLALLKQEGKFYYLPKDYVVEWEGGMRFKLIWRGQVVAPFDDLDELCQFVQQA